MAIRKHLLFVLGASTLASMVPAMGEQPLQLPAGRYVYLGPDANAGAPRAFNVDASGQVIWQDAPASTTEPFAVKPVPASAPDIIRTGEESPQAAQSAEKRSNSRTTLVPKSDPGAAQPITLSPREAQNIEKYEWPMIKFRPKLVPGSKDGFAQLTTTEVLGNAISQYYTGSSATVKYKLILLRSEPQSLAIELLDAEGFRLGNRHVISTNEFETIPDSDLVAARGEFSFPLSDYPRVRDFTLTQGYQGYQRYSGR